MAAKSDKEKKSAGKTSGPEKTPRTSPKPKKQLDDEDDELSRGEVEW